MTHASRSPVSLKCTRATFHLTARHTIWIGRHVQLHLTDHPTKNVWPLVIAELAEQNNFKQHVLKLRSQRKPAYVTEVRNTYSCIEYHVARGKLPTRLHYALFWHGVYNIRTSAPQYVSTKLKHVEDRCMLFVPISRARVLKHCASSCVG